MKFRRAIRQERVGYCQRETYHPEIEHERVGGGGVVEVSDGGNGFHTVDAQYSRSADGAKGVGLHVEVETEVAHALLAVGEVGKVDRAGAVEVGLVPSHPEVGREVAGDCRGKRVDGQPVGELYVFELQVDVFLHRVVAVVRCEQLERADLVFEVDVGVKMFVGHVEADEVVAVDFPLLVADDRVEGHEPQPNGGAVGHRRHKAEAVAGLTFEVLLFHEQCHAVGVDISFCFGVGKLVEGARSVVHRQFIEHIAPFLMQA